VLIAEHQHRGRYRRFRPLFVTARRRLPIGARVQILIFLAAHPLLFEAPLIHLVGLGDFPLSVLIVRRTRIPPPPIQPGIVVTGVPPGPSTTVPTEAIAEAEVSEMPIAIAVAVSAKAVPTEPVAAKTIPAQCRLTKAGMKIGTAAESATGYARVVKSRAAESWISEPWISEARAQSLAVKSATTMHPAERNSAANMAAETATMTCSDSMATATMANTVLRKGGHQCQR
jgi:hypothetical protein